MSVYKVPKAYHIRSCGDKKKGVGHAEDLDAKLDVSSLLERFKQEAH